MHEGIYTVVLATCHIYRELHGQYFFEILIFSHSFESYWYLILLPYLIAHSITKLYSKYKSWYYITSHSENVKRHGKSAVGTILYTNKKLCHIRPRQYISVFYVILFFQTEEEGMRQTNKINIQIMKIKQNTFPMLLISRFKCCLVLFQVIKSDMQNTMSLKVTQIFQFRMKILLSL